MNALSRMVCCGLLTPVLLAVMLVGCSPGGPDAYVLLQDARGLTKAAKVTWKGAEVGSVAAVRAEDGKIRADILLRSDYRGQIRQGVAAKAINGFLTHNTPALELYGGDNPDASPLAKGSQIPEASDYEAYRRGPYLRWAGIGFAILAICCLLKGVKRFIAFLLALALLAGSLWVVSHQWKKHSALLVTPEVEAMLSELANTTIHSPEAADAWQGIRSDVRDVLSEAKEQGGRAVAAGLTKAEAIVAQKADQLAREGSAKASQDLVSLSAAIKKSVGIAAAP